MRNLMVVLVGVALMVGAGCSSDDGNETPVAPSIPTGLGAEGSLGRIDLAWSASTGEGLVGYNVYRSADGGAFAKINASVVTGLAYQDLAVLDGVYYSYKVTAVGDAESDYSATVRSMHGTRLERAYDAGCELAAGALNPYVAEDSVTVAGGNLTIYPSAQLYVLDNAVIDMEFVWPSPVSTIVVNGLLRVVASDAAPAKFTAHKASGTANDGEGFALLINELADDYDPADGSGTLIRNCTIEYLKYSNNAIRIQGCSPRISNCRISSSKSNGASYFEINSTGLTMDHCHVERIVLTLYGDLTTTGLSITRNTWRNGYYSLYLSSATNRMVNVGQIANNDFGETVHGIYMHVVTGTEDVPLSNNYWGGGELPAIIQGGGTTVTVDFAPTLAEPPADCGPTW